MRIEAINPAGQAERPELLKHVAQPADTPSFKETLNGFLNEVNEMQKTAGDAQKKFLAGEVNDVHQVTAASEEANTGFNMLMELRNKALDGFHEAMRTKL
jgi:flagellar hook-basal body complex protein FliE